MSDKENRKSKLLNFLLPSGRDIRVSVFNILAICGAVVSLITAICNWMMGFNMASVVTCFVSVFVSLGLMIYAGKTGNFRFAMVLTVVIIFLGFFTYLFLNTGGINSGFPYFFVFAVVFTAFLLDGAVMPILVVIELVWYGLLCFYTYYYPVADAPSTEGLGYVSDVVLCETLVSAILAVSMFFQMKLYRKKQDELNEAIRVAEEANKAKSDFLAKMSHDIRTPLNMIMAMNEMIVSNTSSEQIREWVNDSNVSGQILLSLIDDMLDLTRIEAGRMTLLSQPWNAPFAFDEIAKVWQLQAGKKGLKFNYTIKPSVPEYLMGDVGVIRKIVNNLLSNAVKYTKKGNVSLLVMYDEDSLIIVVKDTGIGIAPDYLKKIFKPFERGIQDIYRETSGSGLGLAIVKELVDALSGTIDCSSILGKGTEFTVIMPQKICSSKQNEGKSDNIADKSSEAKQPPKNFIAPDARILVVDDNPYNRKVIDGLLGPTLIQIDDVEGGDEALEMIDIKEYDLVLMDLRMPKMDGVETLEKIREEYPDFSTPVVVLTADIMNDIEEKLLNKGFAGFLAKPVSSAKLYEMISRFIFDKMVPLEAENENELTIDDVELYQNMLIPYGVNMKLALEYNAGNTDEFITRAALFTEYAAAGINRLGNPESDESYYLQVHSLKSGAKGVGAYLLAELAETIEFRRDNEFRDIINSSLIDEYKRVCEGLETLLKEVK